MESIFNMNEGERRSLLHHIINSFGCTYICLWAHLPPPHNYLYFVDGHFQQEINNKATSSSSSSSSSLAMRSFIEYQKSIFFFHNSSGGVPGFAFKNNLPYIELKELELLRWASTSPQLQFYQEARIQTAIFMGCKTGELEIGISSDSFHVNMEMEMKKLFREDFSQQVDQSTRASSSSSLSIDNSPEYSPFIYNLIQNTSYNNPEIYAPHNNPLTLPSSSTTIQDPLEQALSEIRSSQIMRSREKEEEAMTKAILAVISSPSPCSSSSSRTPQVPLSAFKRYISSSLEPTKKVSRSRQNMMLRSISFFRNLSIVQAQQRQMYETTRPAGKQLHHMISERKRREKLNESFIALRSLLPPGSSKSNKISVLSNTTEYLTSLKTQVEELKRRNKILEAQISQNEEASSSSLSNDRLNVRIRNGSNDESSDSESRVVELQVNARGESIIANLVIRILEFIKQVENISIMSINAETNVLANRVIFRLRIQGSDWDQTSFEEAVRRVIDDLAQ